MSPEDRATFAHAFESRWGEPPDCQGIVEETHQQYPWWIEALDEHHNGTRYPTVQEPASVAWLDEIRSTASCLLRLLDCREHVMGNGDVVHTFAAGVSLAPWIHGALRREDVAENATSLVSDSPNMSGALGLEGRMLFMSYLAELADDPDQAQAGHLRSLTTGEPPQRPMFHPRRRLTSRGRPKSISEIEGICLRMLTARLAAWFREHGAGDGADNGYAADLAGLLRYHELPLAEHCPGETEGNAEKTARWIRKQVERYGNADGDALMKKAGLKWSD